MLTHHASPRAAARVQIANEMAMAATTSSRGPGAGPPGVGKEAATKSAEEEAEEGVMAYVLRRRWAGG